MNQCLKDVNLSVFVELCKVKKPLKLTFIAVRLLCLLVNSYRETAEEHSFENWVEIQHCVMGNQSKFSQEVSNLKVKATQPYNQRAFNLIKEIIEENKGMIQLATDKNAKILLNLVQSVIDYAESKSQKQDDDERSLSRIERDHTPVPFQNANDQSTIIPKSHEKSKSKSRASNPIKFTSRVKKPV